MALWCEQQAIPEVSGDLTFRYYRGYTGDRTAAGGDPGDAGNWDDTTGDAGYKQFSSVSPDALNWKRTDNYLLARVVEEAWGEHLPPDDFDSLKLGARMRLSSPAWRLRRAKSEGGFDTSPFSTAAIDVVKANIFIPRLFTRTRVFTFGWDPPPDDEIARRLLFSSLLNKWWGITDYQVTEEESADLTPALLGVKWDGDSWEYHGIEMKGTGLAGYEAGQYLEADVSDFVRAYMTHRTNFMAFATALAPPNTYDMAGATDDRALWALWETMADDDRSWQYTQVESGTGSDYYWLSFGDLTLRDFGWDHIQMEHFGMTWDEALDLGAAELMSPGRVARMD